jgi:hypothetical protein
MGVPLMNDSLARCVIAGMCLFAAIGAVIFMCSL